MFFRNGPRFSCAILTALFVILSGCDSNDSGDSAKDELIGTYSYVSITDKTGDIFGEDAEGITLQAGTENSVNGATVEYTGSWTLSQSQYSWDLSITESVPLSGTTTFTESETGTWSVSGSQVTFSNPFNDPADRTMNYTVNGDQLTLEDSSARIVLEK